MEDLILCKLNDDYLIESMQEIYSQVSHDLFVVESYSVNTIPGANYYEIPQKYESIEELANDLIDMKIGLNNLVQIL